MDLYRDRYPGRAVYDTAISHAMLRAVANGTTAESLRLYTPDNALLFSSLDSRRPGYARAVELAREAGFEPVIRLAGGHAAVFLETSMAFAWASADPEAQLHITARFERLTSWVVSTLRNLGLDARVGEVEGEYCPGEFSVNIEGRVKVMGVGQRVIRGGAHVGGVLTIAQSQPLRDVLIPIYDALELDFRPETAGGIADFDGMLTAENVIEAFKEVISSEGHDVIEGRFSGAIESAAAALAPLHSAERRAGAEKALRPRFQSIGGKSLVHETEPSDPDEKA